MNKLEKKIDKMQKDMAELVKMVADEKKTKTKKVKEPKKLEVGKWYIKQWRGEKGDRDVFMIEDIKDDKFLNGSTYFRNGNSLPCDRYKSWGDINDYRYTLTPATDKEVETALIKEAKKRGFKKGASFIHAKHWEIDGKSLINSSKFTYGSNEGEDGYGLAIDSWCIFDNGDWAEIIEDKLELNGKEVTIDNSTVIIGCRTILRGPFESTVNILEEVGITHVIHKDLGDIKVSDLKNLIK